MNVCAFAVSYTHLDVYKRQEGCIPTKTLLYSAKVYDYAKHASKYAVNVPEASFDLGKIVARKSKVVRKLVLGIKAKLTAHQVHIVTGEATIVDKNTIQCGGETYECENLLLCTGSETSVSYTHLAACRFR